MHQSVEKMKNHSCENNTALFYHTALFTTVFYQLKPIVSIKQMVFNNFQKVSSRLGQYLNFSKISCHPPLFPQVSRNYNCFDKRNDNFQKVSTRLGHYLNFSKISFGPPLFTPRLAVVPPLHLVLFRILKTINAFVKKFQ